jgi:hypothetical protein
MMTLTCAQDFIKDHILVRVTWHAKMSIATSVHCNLSQRCSQLLTIVVGMAQTDGSMQVNCVDTGWVTDMAPLGSGAKSKTHRTHVGPPLDEEDGAARVLDPIFTHLANGSTTHGVFFKDYKQSPW